MDETSITRRHDQFDDIETKAPWLSPLASVAYDGMMWGNGLWNRARRQVSLPPRWYAGSVKRRVKRAVQFISNFEQQLSEHAVRRRCDGVVCGHIHTPTIQHWRDVTYCNTGDWVENSTALVEEQSFLTESPFPCTF